MSTRERPLVATHGLAVGYHGTVAAEVPDLEVTSGLVWHVTGANGSGKTALLKTLAGLLPPVAGSVVRQVGMGPGGAVYVHSVPYLFAGTVRRNLLVAQPEPSRVRAAVADFGLGALLDRTATTLSHGQQRRLALARALVSRPALLLVDEPEGGLDEDAVAAWHTCAVRAVEGGEPALVVAAHRPGAFSDMPIREVRL